MKDDLEKIWNESIVPYSNLAEFAGRPVTRRIFEPNSSGIPSLERYRMPTRSVRARLKPVITYVSNIYINKCQTVCDVHFTFKTITGYISTTHIVYL
jgi:hypothetical protein